MEKILIIDDNADIRFNLAELLDLNGYVTFLAGSGMEGIRVAKQECVDIILCDIHMPGMDGFEVCRELKTWPATATLPFIFLTAMQDTGHRCKSLDAGADDFVCKTAPEEELLSAIRCRIKKNKEAQENISAEKLKYISELKNLLNSISHSVRSPLCSSMGLLNLLDDKVITEDRELHHVLEGIRACTLKLDDYTRALTEQIQFLVKNKSA